MAESDWKYLQYNTETGQKRTSDGPSGGPSSLADLDDTSISNPSDGQMLSYDETEGKWVNVAAPTGSVTDVQLDGTSVVNQQGVAALTTPNVSNLKDTNISSPSSGQTLQYNATNNKWENVTPASGGNVDDVKVNGTSVVTNKVANITSYREVTQSQYEALPDSKLSDGVLYAIKDGGEGIEGYPPLIYSDEEREIGVWRDGKPLYQKTIDCGVFHSTGTKTVAHNISNLEFIAAYGGCGKYDSGEFLPIPFPQSSNALNYQVKVYADNTNVIIMSNADDISQIYITLYYTKTTDTPGSGSYSPSGAKAHHYSTNEQVIGTWVDGKPLYEKTITYAVSSGYSSIQKQAHGISNIDKITKCDCYVMLVEWSSQSIVPNGFYSDSSYACSGYANASNCMLRYAFGGISGTAVFTLQYTKTTD